MEKRLLQKKIEELESEKELMHVHHVRLEVERDTLDRRVLQLLDEIESLQFSIRTLTGELTEQKEATAKA